MIKAFRTTMLLLMIASGIGARENDVQQLLNEVMTATKINLIWAGREDGLVCPYDGVGELWLIRYACSVSNDSGMTLVPKSVIEQPGRLPQKLLIHYTVVSAVKKGNKYCVIYGVTEYIFKYEYNKYVLGTSASGGMNLVYIFDENWKVLDGSVQ